MTKSAQDDGEIKPFDRIMTNRIGRGATRRERRALSCSRRGFPLGGSSCAAGDEGLFCFALRNTGGFRFGENFAPKEQEQR